MNISKRKAKNQAIIRTQLTEVKGETKRFQTMWYKLQTSEINFKNYMGNFKNNTIKLKKQNKLKIVARNLSMTYEQANYFPIFSAFRIFLLLHLLLREQVCRVAIFVLAKLRDLILLFQSRNLDFPFPTVSTISYQYCEVSGTAK